MQPPLTETRLLYLDPRQLEPDGENVRRDGGNLDSLADSLRRFGVLQPLGVAPIALAPGERPRYRVIYGNRRREAAILAGMAQVPCVPVTLTGGDRLVAQLLENMQRRDLNDMEQADGLARLRRIVVAELGTGATAEAVDSRVGELVGLSYRTVRRYLALRDLPTAVRDLITEGRLTVTHAQHLGQLATAQQREDVATRAATEEWTAAQVSRVCTALARSPGLSLDDAVDIAAGGWQTVEQLGPAVRDVPVAPAAPAKLPRALKQATAPEESDADLWAEDATGTPTPEATGEVNPFDVAPAGKGNARAGAGESGDMASGTADGHRVFRIRTLAAFCDEADRLARCVQDGDLQRSSEGDPTAATRLRLAARQLGFTLRAVEAMLGGG